MIVRVLLLGICCLSLWQVPATVHAQPGSLDAQNTLKIGLALSGGGAKGFAHIGVLKGLEKAGVPIEVITGTSMGAIVGGLYSIGFTPEMLEQLAVEQDWQALFDDRPRRDLVSFEQRKDAEQFLVSLPLQGARVQLPSGLVTGHGVTMLLARLTQSVHNLYDFSEFPIPFACVATDLETGRGVRLDRGYLPYALRASMAYPSVFTPFEIDGRVLVDGESSRNLPVQDALEMGATFVIGVDVGTGLLPADSLTSLVSIMNQVAGFQKQVANERARREADILISPDVEAFSVLSFDDAKALIESGERAAEAAMPALLALADSKSSPAQTQRQANQLAVDSLLVQHVVVDGLEPAVARQIEVDLGVTPPVRMAYSDLERSLSRAYYAASLDHLAYRLIPSEDGNGILLYIEGRPRNDQRLRVGLRYQTQHRASLLFSALLQGRVGFGTTLRADLRFGEILQGRLRYAIPLKTKPRLALQLEGRATREPLDFFINGLRLASVKVRTLEAGAVFTSAFVNSSQLSAGIRSEFFNYGRDVGDDAFFGDDGLLWTGLFRFNLETFDRPHFPTRGFLLNAQVEGMPAGISRRNFGHLVLNWEARRPLRENWTLGWQVILGHVRGQNIPLHYRFYLGGATLFRNLSSRQFPLLGFALHERAGESVHALSVGIQYEFASSLFARVDWNTARVSNEWSWTPDLDTFREGIGLSAGAATPIGPVELTLSSRKFEGPFTTSLNIGYVF